MNNPFNGIPRVRMASPEVLPTPHPQTGQQLYHFILSARRPLCHFNYCLLWMSSLQSALTVVLLSHGCVM